MKIFTHSKTYRGMLIKSAYGSERREWKSWLKSQHSENEDPITSWEIDGETVETVSGFIFLGSKITADGDCSHEIKDAFSLEEKL